MSNRTLLGQLGSDFLLRTSKPGFNVLTEPFGSKNISFDSRWIGLSTVVHQGAVNVPVGSGWTITYFPDMGFVPITLIVDDYGQPSPYVGFYMKVFSNRIEAGQFPDLAYTYFYYVLNEPVT